MTANASVVIGEKKNVLKIPNSALRFRPPEEAVVTGATNPPAVVPGDTNRVLQLAGGGGEGGPRSGANREEMRRRFESMSPEEREAFRARMGGRGGGERRQNSDRPAIHTIYVLASTNAADNGKGPTLKAVKVKTGLADASFTEVIEGLDEGETIVSGLNVPATQNIAMGGPGGPGGRPSSPFGGPFGGGGGGRPR